MAWKIKQSDIVEVDGDEFVKLGDRQLAKLLGVELITQLCGMRELKELRSQATASADDKGTCSLFEDEQSTPSKKTKVSRGESARQRQDAKVIQVDVDNKSITMLRAVHPLDIVCVRCDEQTLQVVLNFLKHKGFGERRSRNPDGLPSGIQRIHGHGYRVKYRDAENTIKYKGFEELDVALEFHANPLEWIDANASDEEEDDD